MRTRCRLVLFFLTLGACGLGAQSPPSSPPTNTCLDCHLIFEDDEHLGVPAQLFAGDIHAARGLTCAACHGGDPREEDADKSMDPAKGFIGVPKRADIPRLCAHCHSDPAFMRSYNPRLRTDQLAQYGTSVHGQRLRRGDTRVAVCSDCHGIHDIRPASATLSRVHPLRLPGTCAGCHSDRERMKGYEIPTDQWDEYRASVHYQTLAGGDLAAPTCATCHGNHGAAPPGVASVERVCGTCHVFQEQLFDQSPHKKPWDMMELASCLTCHGNHGIQPTGDFLVGTGEEAFCVNCHLEGDGGWETAEKIHAALVGLDSSLGEAVSLLDQAERAGMDVGEARLVQANARENLIKARVDVHAFNAARVEETVESGLVLAAEAHQAGEAALDELAFRRKGLGLSLLAIAFVVFSLWLLIRHIERGKEEIIYKHEQ
ncbi:MAG: cytochrome c3 family protein [Acidobacteria bacterium]|nr:cytochrome c3 family protein [Acidobacteriota bacterium]